MERWIPLFEIFLHSPVPEGDASLWLQNHTASNPTATTAFLSLLLSPSLAPSSAAASLQPPSPTTTPAIFLRTLPPVVQSRILSFLAIEHRRFPRHQLCSLAEHVVDSDVAVSSASGPAFWVYRAACHLLDAISDPRPGGYEAPIEEREKEDEFYALPQWLKDAASSVKPLIPGVILPRIVSPNAARRRCIRSEKIAANASVVDHDVAGTPICEPEFCDAEAGADAVVVVAAAAAAAPTSLDPQVRNRALVLKAELLAAESTSQAVCLAGEIRQLCLVSGAGNALTVLELLEPWEASDETALVLLSNLGGADSDRLQYAEWPAHALCSVALPKFLALEEPASRALLSATMSFCKLHPVAAVQALLFPVAFRKEGINPALCDMLVRVTKECLHPTHVSAYCQQLLCSDENDRKKLVCLPRHRGLLSDELATTESLFVLFQQIMNLDINLTPDTVDQLVLMIDASATVFSRSLKFGNFVLCFLNKFPTASKLHKDILERAAMRTETFLSKSILSKFK